MLLPAGSIIGFITPSGLSLRLSPIGSILVSANASSDTAGIRDVAFN